MATQCNRGPRTALVACAPSLSRIHERIFKALSLPAPDSRTEYGKPGGGYLPAPDFSAVEYDKSVINDFAKLYFASEWLSKLDDGKSSSTKAQVAMQRFEEAETSCEEANHRLKHWRKSPWSRELSLAVQTASRVLGPFSWDEAAKHFRWGPGATTRLTRRKSDAAYKYSGNPHATIGNAILANTIISYSPLWARSLEPLSEAEGVGYVKIVPGNRVVTVPKNYKTDRTIAIEPDMNSYAQLGIGTMMRKRLLRKGVDLNDQSIDQRHALSGAYLGDLCTIDISMASDTMSRSLVELFVRDDWLSALGQCRSPFGVLPSGDKVFYQKYSSMGNGYTFELETLIFWSLLKAYVTIHGQEDDVVSAYGDDLILPSRLAPGFMDLLHYSGFHPNLKKSHVTGYFRESCGKHFFFGYDVTPFYVKRNPETLLDLFKVHNQIKRFIARSDWMFDSDVKALLDVCSWLRGFAPAKWRRPTIVDGLGDGGFLGSFEEILPPKAPRGWDGYVFRSFVTIPRSDLSHDSSGLLVKALATLDFVKERKVLDGATPVGFEPKGDSVVFPIKGTRSVAGKIFVSRRYLSDCTTGYYLPK